jgi:hypothetical protein
MATRIEHCPICQGKADTKEHIIPRWIQKRHNLENQALGLHNGTVIKYNQATIPICQKCNGEKLAILEGRIKSEKASLQDYFNWALKIRYFLTLKDTTLLFDRSDPSKGSLIDKQVSTKGIEFITHSLANCVNADYLFSPNPFGSVFIFDNPIDDEFGMIDLPNPYWGLCITIPNKKILVVLFTDRTMVKESLIWSFKSEENLNVFFQSIFTQSTMDGIKALMFVLCLRQHRIANIPKVFHLYENGVGSDLPESIEYRKADKDFVEKMLARFHLTSNLLEQLPQNIF